jgi:hypothetical protein
MVNKARTSAFGAGSISVEKFSTTSSPIDIPRISSIAYSGDDNATNTAGGDTITINGSFFKSGCFVYVDTTQSSVVSFISSTQITFTAPAKSAGTYTLYVYNPDGGTAIYIPGISYSGTPTWSNAAGSIGTAYETVELSSNVSVLSASSNSTVKYRLYSGSLPTNAVLDTDTGAITGVTNTVAGVTTYTFVIEAYDLEDQGTLRTFSITINPDVVTWSSPADGNTINGVVGTSVSQALSSSSAIGRSITYTANTLPTGLSISGSNITGTPTTAQSLTSLITATASTTNKFATRILNWIIAAASDIYFPYVSLLLKSTATNTQNNSTFLDSSTNNFSITRSGTPTQGSLTPYWPNGYWGGYFTGANYVSTSAASANLRLDQGNWTMEFWLYLTAWNTNNRIFDTGANGDAAVLVIGYDNTGLFYFGRPTAGTGVATASGAITLNRWYHIACTSEGAGVNGRIYIDGVLRAGPTNYTNPTGTTATFNLGRNNVAGGTWSGLQGHMSNFRFVSGQRLYTADFTPQITPLNSTTYSTNGGTSFSNIIGTTQLLTLQSNRFIDNSVNNFSLAPTSSPFVRSFQPFNLSASYTPASYGGSGYFNSGSSDKLSIASNATLALGTGDFTIEFWIYNQSTTNRIITWPVVGAPIIYLNTSNFLVYENYGTATILTSSISVPLNTWAHIVVCRSSSTSKIFINGVQAASGADSNNWGQNGINIGADITTTFMTGYICNLRIVKGTAVYTTAFTPPTAPVVAISGTLLLANFSNAGIYDASSQSNMITVGDAQSSTTQSKWSPTSMKFDGTGDWLTTTTSPIGNGNFTIEFWMYQVSGECHIFTLGTAWADATGVQLIYYNGSNNYCLSVGNTNNNFFGGLIQNAWTHVAIVRSAGTVKLYWNGTATATTLTNSTNLTATNLTLGYSLPTASWAAYSGYMQDFRITKGVARYTSNFSVPTAEFNVR